MSQIDLCQLNSDLGLAIHSFITNVPGVNEESITDYLLWQWKLMDSNFKYISAKPYNRMQEHTLTGADFELELWIVRRAFSVPLLFQAKKFVKAHDGYVRRLNYPGATQNQLTMLLSYAQKQRKMPFYAIYTAAVANTMVLCKGRPSTPSGVFMVSAAVIKEFADKKHGARVSLPQILSHSNPLHCMFCCPMTHAGIYLSRYFPNEAVRGEWVHSTERLPSYVYQILEGNSETKLDPVTEELQRIRTIAVYDLRRKED